MIKALRIKHIIVTTTSQSHLTVINVIMLWVHYLPNNVTNWFNNTASFHSATSNTGKQRGKCKVITRWYHLNIIRGIVEILQETCSSPASAKHHNLLFLNSHLRWSNRICITGCICLRISNKAAATETINNKHQPEENENLEENIIPSPGTLLIQNSWLNSYLASATYITKQWQNSENTMLQQLILVLNLVLSINLRSLQIAETTL